MDKYNINRNREPLTPEDVHKGQNFDAFMKAYAARPKPFFHSSAFYLSVATVGIVIGIGAVMLLRNTDEKAGSPPAFVQPPLAGINVADTVYTVDASAGGDFIYGTGSFIRIPAGAFLDSAGNTVTGKVELHYREFHDPASIFLAGIPMTYDSAGQRFHFESAGMLEITAMQNGKMLKVNPQQPLNLAMASNTDEEKFNIYYLDTLKRNWNFIAKDKTSLIGFVPDTTQTEAAPPNASLLPPVAPKKADNKRHSFAIRFDEAEFPELASYKGVRFEVDETKTPYHSSDKNILWEDVQIRRNADHQSYTVTFTKDETTASYITNVVVDEAHYADAKKTFDQRYAAYLAALKIKKQHDQQLHDAMGMQLMTNDARRIFVNDSVLSRAMAMRRANVGSEKENMVMREFVIRDFGIWNSDCPASLPQGPEMLVKLLDSRTKKPLDVSHVFLVEKGRNAIFTYYSNDLATFRFNPGAENLLWAVTADGKLAVVQPDVFKTIDTTKKSTEITMTVQPGNLASVAEAKAALGI